MTLARHPGFECDRRRRGVLDRPSSIAKSRKETAVRQVLRSSHHGDARKGVVDGAPKIDDCLNRSRPEECSHGRCGYELHLDCDLAASARIASGNVGAIYWRESGDRLESGVAPGPRECSRHIPWTRG